MNCCKLTLSDVVGRFYGWEGTKVHLGVGQKDDSSEWNVRYAWNVGIRYKVQCGHADSSEWNVWYAWNAGIRYKVQCEHADSSQWNVIHYANNAMLTDRPCVPPLPP